MVSSSRRAYKREIVVRILELGIIGVNFIDEDGDCFAIFVAFDRPACAPVLAGRRLFEGLIDREVSQTYRVCRKLQ